MKNLILIVCTLFLSAIQVVGQTKTFILVRHAEKEQSMMADPNLTALGVEQSQALQKLISPLSLSAVYSTPYVRTQKTVEPSAVVSNLQVQFYQPLEGNKLLAKLLKSEDAENNSDAVYLISGHSNTIPEMVNFLMGNKAVEPMPETDYGKVFIVQQSNNAKPTLVILQLPECGIKAD